MKIRKYLVEIISRQRSLYEIEAAGADAAERHALVRWRRNEPSDIPGLDGPRLEALRSTAEVDEIRMRQDDELLLRFIRERERLQRRWNNGGRINASHADGISAHQIAAGLGWYRTDIDEESVPDVIRAAQGLERLCGRRRLVGFEGGRSRPHERGPMRVYCTPEHLDRLSSAIENALERPA